jgi:hypothetical protein
MYCRVYLDRMLGGVLVGKRWLGRFVSLRGLARWRLDRPLGLTPLGSHYDTTAFNPGREKPHGTGPDCHVSAASRARFAWPLLNA